MKYRVTSFKEYKDDGLIECEFEHNGKMYEAYMKKNTDYGDVCKIHTFGGMELVYSKYGVPVTEDRILECIEEFVYGARGECDA